MSLLYQSLADVLSVVLRIYQFLLLAAVVLHWVGADPGNPIVRAVRALTEPFFAWLRRRLPFLVVGGIDLSPLAAYLVTVFLARLLVGGLYRLSAGA